MSTRPKRTRDQLEPECNCEVDGVVSFPIKRRKIEALTEAQGHYILSIKSKTITFGVGPAGTGKTLVAAALAADAFVDKKIKSVVISRPTIEVGSGLGFLPGTMEEKYRAHVIPVYEVLRDRIGKSQLEYAVKAGQVEFAPLEYMRGRTFNDSWVILDEAQNATRAQTLMLLTRTGRNCTIVVNGDPDQCDLRHGESGLVDAIERLEGIDGVGVIEFTWEDVVRSGIVKKILKAYSKNR